MQTVGVASSTTYLGCTDLELPSHAVVLDLNAIARMEEYLLFAVGEDVMVDDDGETGGAVRSLLAEFGIVDPVEIGQIEDSHREMFDACRSGKITQAALRHSLANDPNCHQDVTLVEK